MEAKTLRAPNPFAIYYNALRQIEPTTSLSEASIKWRKISSEEKERYKRVSAQMNRKLREQKEKMKKKDKNQKKMKHFPEKGMQVEEVKKGI